MILRSISSLLLIHTVFAAVLEFASHFQSNSFTDADAAGWTIGGSSVPTSNLMTFCNGVAIFGGFEKFHGDPTYNPTTLSRTYSSLPPHWSARVQIIIYKIDSWNNQRLSVLIDNVVATSYTWSPSFGSSDICGTVNPTITTTNPSYNDGFVLFDKNISHSASTLKIDIATDLDQYKGEYWGIREVKVYLDTCSAECQTCDGSTTSCLSCVPDTFMVSTSSAGYVSCSCSTGLPEKKINCLAPPCWSCITTCDTGYYSDGIACQPCTTGCGSCTGPTLANTFCSSCANLFYYNSSNTAAVCLTCHTTCYSCTGPSSIQCSACTGTLFLSGTTCVASCPTTKYAVETTHTCNPCATNCATCFAASSTSCLTCSTGWNLLVNACVSTCPTGYFSVSSTCVLSCATGFYYDNSVTGTCVACPSGCATCTSDKCMTCLTGYQLLNGACPALCTGATYLDTNTGTCGSCFTSCTACFNYTENSCTACISGYILAASTCTDNCIDGTYMDPATRMCLPCDSTCATCTDGTNKSCTSCATGLYFDVNITECIAQCDSSLQAISEQTLSCWTCPTPYQPARQLCVICHYSCLACNGSNFDECITCKDGRIELPNFGMCSCPVGTSENMASCGSYNPFKGIPQMIWYLVLGLGTFCLILQILFKHNTIFLPSIQGMQMISICYFVNTVYPFGVDNVLEALLRTNISRILPSLVNIKYEYRTIGRMSASGIQSYFAHDGTDIPLGFIILGVLALLCKLIMKFTSVETKMVHNAARWLEDKLTSLLRVWYKITILYFGMLVAINYQKFKWGNQGDMLSLALVIIPVIVCVLAFLQKTEQTPTQAPQYFWAYSVEYDYTSQKSQSTPLKLDSNNDSKSFLLITQQANKSKALADSNIDLKTHKSNNLTSTNEKEESPPKSKQEPVPTAEEPHLDNREQAPYAVPLFNYVLRLVLGFSTPLLAEFPLVQGLLNFIICLMIGSSHFACKYKRKAYKLYNCLWGVTIILNSIFVLALVVSSNPVWGLLMGGVILLATISSLLLAFSQLAVNVIMIPNIFKTMPLKIESILSKRVLDEPEDLEDMISETNAS